MTRHANNFNLFVCLGCENNPEFSLPEFKTHLKEVHSIEETKGTKETVSCMDGAGWYQRTYLWDIKGFQFQQIVRGSK